MKDPPAASHPLRTAAGCLRTARLLQPWRSRLVVGRAAVPDAEDDLVRHRVYMPASALTCSHGMSGSPSLTLSRAVRAMAASAKSSSSPVSSCEYPRRLTQSVSVRVLAHLYRQARGVRLPSRDPAGSAPARRSPP